MRSNQRWLMVAAVAFSGAAVAEPLVGPSVGNADVLISEGNRLYSTKKYAKAASKFLAATRANPTATQPYLVLARSYARSKQVPAACNAYRAYLTAAPDAADRAKAERELTNCERRLKRVKRSKRIDLGPKYVETKAQFFAALDEKNLFGSGSASMALRTLIRDGYVGPDLAEMGSKLNTAAGAAAEDLYRRVMAHERIPAHALRDAKQLYQLAVETGSPPQGYGSHSAFIEGLADFQSFEAKRAEQKFAEASAAEPTVAEYKFYRAAAIYRGGDKAGALEALEKDLPQDPRTAVMREAQALGSSSQAGATELEQLLFTRRFSAGK
jgi:thioredoxin-like negative regulator of GroEL